MSHTLPTIQNRIQTVLANLLNQHRAHAARLQAANSYVLNLPGKFVRPCLVYLTGATFGVNPEQLDAPAAAVELIHCYSLIHDDLPAMDDADLRRGQPSCHTEFDEATAILAGDALQSMAFEQLAFAPDLTDTQRIRMVQILSQACGPQGMAAGQTLDLFDKRAGNLDDVHHLKTGALINASVQLGALAYAAVTEDQLNCLSQFAFTLGLSFQIQDDILDVLYDNEQLGKPKGQDADNNSDNYVSVYGLEQARLRSQRGYEDALNYLDQLTLDVSGLKAFVSHLMVRDS